MAEWQHCGTVASCGIRGWRSGWEPCWCLLLLWQQQCCLVGSDLVRLELILWNLLLFLKLFILYWNIAKNWCFCTVVLEKALESPLDCRRSNKSILKEISPEYSLDGLMLKLKLQYFDHMMQRTDSLETTLMLGLFVSFYIFNNSLDVIIILECLQDPAQPSLPDLYNTRSMLSN